MALTTEQLNALYAKRRKKGEYALILNEQMESDENGFAAKATYPQLAGKEASTIYQGFRNAMTKLGLDDSKIDIINSDEEVFVIFTDRVELAK